MKRILVFVCGILVLPGSLFAQSAFEQLQAQPGYGSGTPVKIAVPEGEAVSPSSRPWPEPVKKRKAVAKFVERMSGKKYRGSFWNHKGKEFPTEITAPPYSYSEDGYSDYSAAIRVQMAPDKWCTNKIAFHGMYSISLGCVSRIGHRIRNRSRSGWGNILNVKSDSSMFKATNTTYDINFVLTAGGGLIISIVDFRKSKRVVSGYFESY